VNQQSTREILTGMFVVITCELRFELMAMLYDVLAASYVRLALTTSPGLTVNESDWYQYPSLHLYTPGKLL
jgi:hypothetical protein